MKAMRVFGLLTGCLLIIMPLQAWEKTTESGEVTERLQQATTVLSEIMKIDDKSIPEDLLRKAHCVAIVPSLKKGAFIVGAKYGKGFLTCRDRAGEGWSAPAAVKVEGGSIGFQIGGGETDLVLLIMNQSGADKLMKSEFKVGGEAAVMAGPVGRTASAETDAFMRAEMLSWSRSHGVFAGIALEGSTFRQDLDANQALYGSRYQTEDIIRARKAKVPAAASGLINLLARYSPIEKP